MSDTTDPVPGGPDPSGSVLAGQAPTSVLIDQDPSSAPPDADDANVRRRRWMLLVAAAVIAGAGVAYELSLMLLGTVTVGSTERANAVVLGAAMFGMGVGATTGGRMSARPVEAFVAIECVLAVLGASAAPFLYWTWASLDAFWGPLLGVAFAIGVCIGAEMPLLASLNERLSRQSATIVISAYTAADYYGALIGAVAFAFLLRPSLGLVDGTIAIAVLNVAVAGSVALIVPARRGRVVAGALAVTALALVVIASNADRITDDGRQRLFRDPIVAHSDTGIQDVVVTSRTHPGGQVDTRLFLDGDLQVSSIDSHRYHESLVHPVLSTAEAQHVLILGGGDCIAAREVLRHPSVTAVTLVELDPEVIDLASSVPELRALNGDACIDPRVTVVNADAFTWVRSALDDDTDFDAVVADFPDPDNPALGRLYSEELYGMILQLVGDDGALVVQCGSPYFAPEAYWTCAETLEAAGWATTPYHVDVPSFGDWGFHLAVSRHRETGGVVASGGSSGETAATVGTVETGGSTPTRTHLSVDPKLELRFLDAEVLAAAEVFPADVRRERFDVRPSTVLDPAIVEAAQGAWIGYD